MSIFSAISDSIKRKIEENKERREFLDMVEEKAKPIRRSAYLKQVLEEAEREGTQKAKQATSSRLPKKNKSTESDFGIIEGLTDPYKYLRKQEKKKNITKKPKGNKNKNKFKSKSKENKNG